MYGPGAPSQNSLYGSTIPSVSGLGLSTGMQGLSIINPVRNTPQFVSRSNTAPGAYGTMGGLGNMSQMGAPSPPPVNLSRGGMLPLGSGRSSLMSTGQGLTIQKPLSRPSSLSSAIGSALPVNAYGGFGRSQAVGMMSPLSSGYSTALSELQSQGFDPSDFPVLSTGSRLRHDSSGGLMSSNTLSRPGYGGPIGLSKSESVPGFQMTSEDFPALPGTTTKSSDHPETPTDSKTTMSMMSSAALPETRATLSYDPAPGSNKERTAAAAPIGPPKSSARKSYQATTVSIPPGMVQDQFGIMGLLTFIRGADSDPNLVALALGSDLTTLGLNLNSPESLYNTFASPWADAPCRPQDIDYSVPQEYLVHPFVREKLAPIRLNRYNEDLLFYLYYSNGGDLLQMLAAAELYSRDWRYHKEQRLWITRAPGMKPNKQEATYEEGTYCYFDMQSWRKTHKEFHVEYDKLEDRPQMPQHGVSLQAPGMN
ncbi:CCR4-NOT transcription complex subunit 2-like isoform X2 [Halichondria panicea]|uniref:CCR4-NOT transcription complex subunit 2-like isoform X2 n=1 Tax=Halichondria panicea TaxID=6063 RepID=UPI00312BBAF9